MIYKSYDEIEKMTSNEIKLEMLKIWHDIDFNPMTPEERYEVKEQLKKYRSILKERNYNY